MPNGVVRIRANDYFDAKAQIKEGTGLELAITKELVTRYGGQISAKPAQSGDDLHRSISN